MSELKRFEQILENKHINYFTRETLEALKAEYEKALQQLREEEARIARLKEKEAEFDIIYVALFNLVNLKSHKDTFGKTDFYQKQQPVCWQAAKDALTGKLAKQSLAHIQADAVEQFAKDNFIPRNPESSNFTHIAFGMLQTIAFEHAQQLREKASLNQQEPVASQDDQE